MNRLYISFVAVYCCCEGKDFQRVWSWIECRSPAHETDRKSVSFAWNLTVVSERLFSRSGWIQDRLIISRQEIFKFYPRDGNECSFQYNGSVNCWKSSRFLRHFVSFGCNMQHVRECKDCLKGFRGGNTLQCIINDW